MIGSKAGAFSSLVVAAAAAGTEEEEVVVGWISEVGRSGVWGTTAGAFVGVEKLGPPDEAIGVPGWPTCGRLCGVPTPCADGEVGGVAPVLVRFNICTRF